MKYNRKFLIICLAGTAVGLTACGGGGGGYDGPRGFTPPPAVPPPPPIAPPPSQPTCVPTTPWDYDC